MSIGVKEEERISERVCVDHLSTRVNGGGKRGGYQ